MSETADRIAAREAMFKRMLRNRARRLLFRNRQIEMLDALGLFEEEEPCGKRGGLYCLLGLRSDSCFLCCGLVSETVKPTPLYDQLVQELGIDPDKGPEPLAAPVQVEDEKPTPSTVARRKGVRSRTTVMTGNKEG